MTTKEAAYIWGISQSRVQKYCREGFIDGAIKMRQWQIPDTAYQPFYFTSKKAQTQQQQMQLILKALNQQKTIPITKLSRDTQRVNALFTLLLQERLVTPIQTVDKEKDWFQTHQLTQKGIDFLNQRKPIQIAMEIEALLDLHNQTITPKITVRTEI